MSETKLKPCPFCGEQPDGIGEGMGECWINHHCDAIKMHSASQREMVTDAWNTRVGTKEEKP